MATNFCRSYRRNLKYVIFGGSVLLPVIALGKFAIPDAKYLAIEIMNETRWTAFVHESE